MFVVAGAFIFCATVTGTKFRARGVTLLLHEPTQPLPGGSLVLGDARDGSPPGGVRGGFMAGMRGCQTVDAPIEPCCIEVVERDINQTVKEAEK